MILVIKTWLTCLIHVTMLMENFSDAAILCLPEPQDLTIYHFSMVSITHLGNSYAAVSAWAPNFLHVPVKGSSFSAHQVKLFRPYSVYFMIIFPSSHLLFFLFPTRFYCTVHCFFYLLLCRLQATVIISVCRTGRLLSLLVSSRARQAFYDSGTL